MTIQPKQNCSQNGTPISPNIGAGIKSLRGSGQPLPDSVRGYFEPRFGSDFSRVRIHTDSRAAISAQSLNAKAYTLGQNIVFGNGEYSPERTSGKNLLAHELTHVVQQTMGNNPDRIQRWPAAGHDKLTREVIKEDFNDKFSWRAKIIASQYSGDMDIRLRNYQWYVLPKVPIAGYLYKKTDFHYAREIKEAPNHGEANLYDSQVGTSKTGQNIERMMKYVKEATDKGNKSGINDLSLLPLGYALHVAQDRGAHGEGEWGKGHSKNTDEKGKKWNCDDLEDNKIGKKAAKDNSKKVLELFLGGLASKRKSELRKAIIPEKTAIGGIEITKGVALTKGKPLFYAGMMGYGVLPGKRLFGVLSPIMSGGIAYYGGKKHMLTGENNLGLRIMRITPRVYVDMSTGAAFGYNISDDKLMVGIANALKFKYTGSEVDMGVVFKNVYDIIGNQNILVVGVSGSF